MNNPSRGAAHDVPGRVSQACRACASNHVRCTESKPCRRCSEKGLECVFTPADDPDSVTTAPASPTTSQAAQFLVNLTPISLGAEPTGPIHPSNTEFNETPSRHGSLRPSQQPFSLSPHQDSPGITIHQNAPAVQLPAFGMPLNPDEALLFLLIGARLCR